MGGFTASKKGKSGKFRKKGEYFIARFDVATNFYRAAGICPAVGSCNNIQIIPIRAEAVREVSGGCQGKPWM